MIVEVEIEEAKSLLGEAFQTALRKAGYTAHSERARAAIDAMDADELDAVWDFALSGLAHGGFLLAKEEEE